MASLKLTAFSRLLIVVAIAVAAFFIARQFVPALQNIGGNGNTTEVTTDANANNGNTTNSNVDNKANNNSGNNNNSNANANTETTKPSPSNNNSTLSNFSYTPTAPQNGTLKGVVELGASGFNSFIVNIDARKNWKLQKADWGNSFVYDKMATARDIRDGLKAFIGDMVDYGVTGKNIHFVVSSGAQKVDNTLKIIKELQGMGYFVNTVTPEQEGRYALQASLPKQYYGNSFMVDIGSGNTKISYIQNAQVKALETYGAKYYKDNVDDATVYREVRQMAGNLPAGNTRTCFILGGVPFKLAKEVRKDDERYTVLKAPSGYTPEGAKMTSGVNIYKALSEGTNCDTFVFDWEGNFTIGFLLGL